MGGAPSILLAVKEFFHKTLMFSVGFHPVKRVADVASQMTDVSPRPCSLSSKFLSLLCFNRASAALKSVHWFGTAVLFASG